MNMIILLGNITRTPEIRYTQGDTSYAIAYFDMAVNRPYAREGEPDADFFHCVAFRKQAEVVEKYFRKGSRLSLVGRVQNNNYTNKNGEKVYGVQVIIEKIEFAERKSVAEKNSGNSLPPDNENDNRGREEDFSTIPDGLENNLPFM